MLGLLARTGGCDLGTMYRALIGLLGTGVVLQVGELLARLIRDGVVEIDTTMGPGGPRVGIARLARMVHPPYAALGV